MSPAEPRKHSVMLLFSCHPHSKTVSSTCLSASCWTPSGPSGRRNADSHTSTFFRNWVGLLLLGSLTASSSGSTFKNQAIHSGGPAPSAQFYNLPMQFEPNVGQTGSKVQFLSRGPGYTLFLTPTQAVLSLRS